MTGNTLPPKAIQLFGMAMLTFFVVFWAFTGRVEPTLLAIAGGLIGGGGFLGAIKSLQGGPPPPTSPPAPPVAQLRPQNGGHGTAGGEG